MRPDSGRAGVSKARDERSARHAGLIAPPAHRRSLLYEAIDHCAWPGRPQLWKARCW